MISIQNLKNGKPTFPYDIVICDDSILSNPYKMAKEWQRPLVCNRYEVYFNAMINENIEWLLENNFDISKVKKFKNELNKLNMILKKYGQLCLWCHCHPLRCHGETIKNYLLIHY